MSNCLTASMTRLMPLLLFVACGPKTADEGDGSKAPAELLEEACASFCERALSCPLGRYAEAWEFQDEQTCNSQCLLFAADVFSDPPEMCVLVRAELWSCAGAIESCELFEAFEDTTHEEPNAFGNPCPDEYKSFIQKCNTP
jgi:hypothetical protein